MKKEEQKVLCLVDTKSIWAHALQAFQAKIDYVALKNHIIDGRQLLKAIAYFASDPIKDKVAFLRHIKRLGFSPRLKMAYRENGKYENADWFEEMSQDALRYVDRYDVLALVSSDDRFLPLIGRLQSMGKQVEVTAWSTNMSGEICVKASDFRFLDESVLMKGTKSTVRPLINIY